MATSSRRRASSARCRTPTSASNTVATRVLVRRPARIWGARDYNWQTGVSLQQELVPGVAATLSYFHTTWNNFRVTDNLLVTPTDYDPYCVTLPADCRLPGRRRQSAVRPVQHHTRRSSAPSAILSFRQQVRQADRNLQRCGSDGQRTAASHVRRSSGGLNMGRTATSNCAVIDSPSGVGSGTNPNQPLDFLQRHPTVPASRQIERRLSAAVGHAGERRVPEQSRGADHGHLRRHQRAGAADASAPAVGQARAR